MYISASIFQRISCFHRQHTSSPSQKNSMSEAVPKLRRTKTARQHPQFVGGNSRDTHCEEVVSENSSEEGVEWNDEFCTSTRKKEEQPWRPTAVADIKDSANLHQQPERVVPSAATFSEANEAELCKVTEDSVKNTTSTTEEAAEETRGQKYECQVEPAYYIPDAANDADERDATSVSHFDDFKYGFLAPFQGQEILLDIFFRRWLVQYGTYYATGFAKACLPEAVCAACWNVFKIAATVSPVISAIPTFFFGAVMSFAVFILGGTALVYLLFTAPNESRNFLLGALLHNGTSTNRSLSDANSTAVVHDAAEKGAALGSSTTLWILGTVLFCLIHPLFDEIFYRMILPMVLMKCLNLSRPRRYQQNEVRGCDNSTIVSICSCCYAIAHMTNKAIDGTEERLSNALSEIVSHYLFASWVVAPAYKERGLVAAWAAHACLATIGLIFSWS